MKRLSACLVKALSITGAALLSLGSGMAHASPLEIANTPLFLDGAVAEGIPPMNMLVMGRDHKLFYEAYNDASDLDGDGVLDVGYRPEDRGSLKGIDYFGYFDSYKCYTYDEGRFTPASKTSTKQCSNAWSGDFLNYLTTARIDALRKVLYGGKRFVDEDDETVLERTYVPQEAHSWGKEYTSVAKDGYDIGDYAPLGLPDDGTRHLFANTTLLYSGNGEPLLRVLEDSPYRIWEWVSIEQPVAGDRCLVGGDGPLCMGDYVYSGHPNNSAQFQALVDEWAVSEQHQGSDTVSQVDDSGNPYGDDDYYLTIIKGWIFLPNWSNNTYHFAVDGDDAVEVIVDGQVVVGWYGGHGNCGCKTHDGSITRSRGWYPIEFRHEEQSGGDNYQLFVNRFTSNSGSNDWERVDSNMNDGFRISSSSSSANDRLSRSFYSLKKLSVTSPRSDYNVRVEACVSGLLEPNCKLYPSGHYKPTGLLHEYGENDRMLFGLITGSYLKNLAGGVLRKPMGSFSDEVDATTGQLSNVDGIIQMIDKLRIVDFGEERSTGRNSYYYEGHLVEGPMTAQPGDFPDWGNPIAEMMFESLRYFVGEGEPTPAFLPALTDGKEHVLFEHSINGESSMDLPVAEWDDPYEQRPWCAKGAQLIISDVNPSYDTDQIPDSEFENGAGDGVAGFNAATQTNAVWAAEHGGSSQHFIGDVKGGVSNNAPTEKTVSGLATIRGLSPEEPSKQGGYYSAGIARYGFLGAAGDPNDLSKPRDIRSDLNGDQNIETFAVALASPLPKIEIPVNDNVVTVVPFAKSVNWSNSTRINPSSSAFQPTNTIVDFYIETFANTDPGGADADASVNGGRPYIKFRINYEDVEQGADHDMDAIVSYELSVNVDGTLRVKLDSEYAAGGIEQHMGYVISGTERDGLYLEVRDCDTANPDQDSPCQRGGNGPDAVTRYYLDTPPGVLPGQCGLSPKPTACNVDLPLTATRTFMPSSSPAATLLENPLWYAAKYGSTQPSDIGPGDTADTYFLVTNASTLSAQLGEAFKRILQLAEDSTATVSESPELRDGSLIYKSTFNPDDWTGDVIAYELIPNADDPSEPSVAQERWRADSQLPAFDSRSIWTWDPHADTPGIVEFDPEELSDPLKQLLVNSASFVGSDLFPDLVDSDPEGADYDTAVTRVIEYLRGSDEFEAASDAEEEDFDDATESVFRYRSTKIGDIISSRPVVDSLQVFDWFNIGAEDEYADFVEEKANRDPERTLYIGANDGMLHAFDGTESGGDELFAYIPSAVFSKLNLLVDPGYSHQYYVDASPVLGDAIVNDSWETVLVGSAGAGGRGVFALNVTEPRPGADGPEVLWDISTSTSHDTAGFDEYLGYVMGTPLVYRLSNGDWAAIFGNGYNSAKHQASLYVVRFDRDTNGVLDVTRIDTTTDESNPIGDLDNPNGLSSPRLIRATDDSGQPYAAFVYAGDLHGNLWKFDLRDESPENWSVVNDEPMFVAQGPNGEVQPIYTQPDIAVNPEGGRIVYFGTGKYFEISDPGNTEVQTFYAVRDTQVVGEPADGESTLFRDDLLERSLSETISSGDQEVRKIAGDRMDWSTHDGWYLDLIMDNPEGERVIQNPQVLLGLLFFTSYEPSEDPCEGGGINRTYVLDALDGKARINLSKVDPDSELGDLADDCGPGGGGCASVLASQGAPISPPVVVVDKMCDGVKCGREIQLLVDVRPGDSGGDDDDDDPPVALPPETLTVREVIDGRVFWRRTDDAVFSE